MVGGFAANTGTFSRITKDLDIWEKDDKPNRQNLGKWCYFNNKEVLEAAYLINVCASQKPQQ